MKLCFCGSEKKFKVCCEPFLTGKRNPDHPQQLMRSRYTAYCLKNMTYIKKTMRGKALEDFLRNKENFQNKQKWISLKVLHSSLDENNTIGYVEFSAQYSEYGKVFVLHEKSTFHCIDGNWYYVEGVMA